MQISLKRRGLKTSLTLVAASAAALSAAAIASAQAATNHSSSPRPAACSVKAQGPARVGRIGGIIRAVPSKPACQVHTTGDPAIGSPPLWFHGGNVMGTG
jgi:hypothetical protein